MPVGPTEFVRAPWIESVEQLDGDLVQIRGRASIAPGRDWLARGSWSTCCASARPRG